MIKSIVVVLLMVTFVFGAKVTHGIWEEGQTFSDYLEKRGIPYSILGSISEDDIKFLSEIQSDATYYEMFDNDHHLIQSLIPINSEMQIHLYKDKKMSEYGFDIIPIEYEEKEYFADVTIESNPYSDTLITVKENNVAKRLGYALKESIDTRKLRKGDKLSFLYKQRIRLGEIYDMPDIKVVNLSSRGKEYFIYVDEDGDGHIEGAERSQFIKNGDFMHEVLIRDRSKQLGMPLRHVRITSRFTYRRWHPILKQYRPHHGTDFGAKRGTPLLAVYDGKVSYAGWMKGYGKTVKIRHPRGYESLYAHQSRIRVRRGENIKKGQIIGYVGNTGRSTGPHLHFGLKKNGKWVDPMRHIKQASLSKEKYTKIIIKNAQKNKENLLKLKSEGTPTYVWSQAKSENPAIGR